MLKTNIAKKRRVYIAVMSALMKISTLLTASLVVFLVSYILMKGIPHISWELISTKPSYLTGKIGILPDILN